MMSGASFRPEGLSIHLDAVGGAAGDMFVACMLDAFPHLQDQVFRDVRSVLPDGVGTPKLEAGSSSGIRALRFGLDQVAEKQPVRHAHGHGDHHHHHPHHHDHDYDHHHHEGHDHAHADHASDGKRARFIDLVSLIEGSPIADTAKHHATAILRRLAQAEAHIHGVAIEDVHFHELADWDSLMDVVAAGSIIAAIGAERWSVSPLPLGSGLVRTQHGLLPVPAPATTLILKGFAWRDDGVAGERVTPTGAAIIAHLVDPSSVPAKGPRGSLLQTGIGAGTRNLPAMPNILRALVFSKADAGQTDTVDVLEFDVDDMTGEEIGIAVDRLRSQAGVLDISTATRMGKKGRPLTEFRLLCAAETGGQVSEACFLQTTTIGLRIRSESRKVLSREHSQTAGLRLKSVSRPGGLVTGKVESDDLGDLDTLDARRRAARALEHRQ